MDEQTKTTQFKRVKAVSLFGFADAQPDSELYQSAFEVAKIFAIHIARQKALIEYRNPKHL